MANYDDLMKMLCDELEDIKKDMRSRGASAETLDAIRDITSSIKNIYKIEMFEDLDGYSGDWDDDRDMYRRGNSYARRGTHYVRGHYSRGRYSRDDAKSHMIDQLDEMMEQADTAEMKDAIRRCKDQLDRA